MEFDYVIVGGGSAGPILARRLADAGIGTVCLIEAGAIDEDIPCLMDISRLYEQSAATDWGFQASVLADEPARLNYPRAKILGGCGNHNDCAWVIPPDSDFDGWEKLGAAGWSADAVHPYFRRLEERVRIETRPSTHPISTVFLQAGRDLGLEEIAFRDGVRRGIGMLSLNAIGRMRQSSSVAYLHPVRDLPANLQILTETMAIRIVLDGRAAVGCETTRGHIVARRETILSAGSIQSPHLLMVSGIGHPSHLKDLGIVPSVPLVGVGDNLADHASAATVLELAEPVPPWEVTPYETIMMLKIDDDAPAPDSLCHFGLTVSNPDGRYAHSGQAVPLSDNRVDIAPNVCRPRSRGMVRLASADMRDPPIVRLNYFSDPEGYDLRILREALRFSRRFLGTPPMRHLAAREIRPGPDVSRDDELDDYIRTTCEPVHHAAGTCRMGAINDPTGVVTPDFRVKGTYRLRVCDASVFPTMVTVNINSTVMMLAERAADFVISDARRCGTAQSIN